MRGRHLRLSRLTVASAGLGLCLAAGFSCGGNDGSPASTGGAPGTGGSTPGTGGSPGTGGKTGTGGVGTGGGNATGGATGGSTGGADGGTGGKGAQGGGTSATGGSGPQGGKGGQAPPTGTGGSANGGSSGAGAVMSKGCGKPSTLKNTTSNTINYNMITSGGMSQKYALRLPQNYDNTRPYRLVIDLHGANGTASEAVSSGFYGLYNLSGNSTIFVALEAIGKIWSADRDTTYANDVLTEVENDLCVDTTRVELEGFSQGAAMAWTLACAKGGVFRAAVGHSGGGVANPKTCEPIAYLGSLGIQESSGMKAEDGHGQKTQTDQFAKWNGCTIATFLPSATTGSHVCTDYAGCPTGKPVRWCSYDGGHTPSPTDSGQRSSWMPMEVWTFLSKL